MNTPTRWGVRIIGLLAALMVVAIWRGIDKDVGGGWISGAIRGGLLIAFVIWLWSMTKAKAMTQSTDSAKPVKERDHVHGAAVPHSTPAESEPPSVKADEELYADASAELNGATRRPGLWAKAFAEADGDDNKAKAHYLKARVAQMAKEQGELAANRRERELQQRRSAFGICPSCEREVARTLNSCPHCRAVFGPGYQLKPIQ